MSADPLPAPRFEATVLVESVPPPMAPAQASRLLRDLARRLRVPHASVAVLFAGDERLRDLNRRYRGKDRPTDVLSFPGDASHLGDIAVSGETTRRQARRFGQDPEREARLLLIHGFLHLLGYDHETDDGQMEVLERTLRAEMLTKRGRRGTGRR